jgi:ABC-type multidrug transport system permease subunit
MYLTLIINSIVCVAGTIAGVLFAGASIISIANMEVPWRGLLLVAAALVPVTFVVSGIGAWLAYAWDVTQVAIGLVALPWIYGVIFVLLMLMSFKS